MRLSRAVTVTKEAYWSQKQKGPLSMREGAFLIFIVVAGVELGPTTGL